MTRLSLLLGSTGLTGLMLRSPDTGTVSGQPATPGDTDPNAPPANPEGQTDGGTPDGNTEQAPPLKAKRVRAPKKAAGEKAPKKAAAAKAPKAPKAAPEPRYSEKKIRAMLTEAEVKITAKTSMKRLMALIAEHEIDPSEALLASGSIVPPKYKLLYGAKGNCGDELAEAFDAMRDGKGKLSEETLEQIAEANGVDTSKWARLNFGQRSMNLRNVLRAKRKNGEAIQVGRVKLKVAA